MPNIYGRPSVSKSWFLLISSQYIKNTDLSVNYNSLMHYFFPIDTEIMEE